jgi:hypothetical protein
MDGAQVAVLTFEERSTPRVVPSPDNTPVSGRFWTDVVSGAVTRTEVVLRGTDFDYRTTVTYKIQPKLRMRLPVGMQRRVDIVRRLDFDDMLNSHIAPQSFEARATYSKFRFLQNDVRQSPEDDHGPRFMTRALDVAGAACPDGGENVVRAERGFDGQCHGLMSASQRRSSARW